MAPLSTDHAARHEIYDELDWKLAQLDRPNDLCWDSASTNNLPETRVISLNENFTLGSLLRYQSHYEAYSVDEQGENRHDLEARLYLLDSLDAKEVSAKERKHRLRCIKRLRLTGRVVFEVDVPKFRIVVFRRGPADDDHFTETEDIHDGHHPRPEGQISSQKSSYQRQSARARQRDRRQATRKAKREQVPPSPSTLANASDGQERSGVEEDAQNDDGGITVDASGDVDNFWMLVLFYLAYDENGELYEQTLPDAEQALLGMNREAILGVLQRYHDQKTLEFTGADEMAEYADIKQSELVFLKRQLKKMASVDQHYKNKFLHAKREQQQRSVITQFAQHRLKVVRHVTKALPRVIRRTAETQRELRASLKLARQQEAEKKRFDEILKDKEKNLDRLTEQRDGLRKRLKTLTSWFNAIVPLLATQAELEVKWNAVEAQLKATEQARIEAEAETEGVSREMSATHRILSVEVKVK